MENNWTLLIALGSLIVAGVAFLSKSFDKSLSIREHEEFSKNTKERITQVEMQGQRDDDRLERRIEILEQTRPTTGELEARFGRKGEHP